MKWYSWLILSFALALVGALLPAPAPVYAGGPVFNPPTVWPASLDELYTLIDTGAGNWVWTNPCPADVGMSLSWRDARSLHAGHDEDALFYHGMLEHFNGRLLACKPEGDRVLFYGPALPELFELLKEPNK